MPFTTSHPACVLPLKHLFPRWFSLTGLMAGAMAPDLIYFLMTNTAYRGVSHSWTGLFVFCLPAAVLFSFVFHQWFKRDFIVNLPRPLDRRLSGLAEQPFAVVSLRAWTVLVLSVLIGTLSHFFWDSFTHAGGFSVKHLPFLADEVTLFGVTRPVHRLLQHASTVIGAVVVPWYILRFGLIPPPVSGSPARRPGEKVRFWLGLSAFSLIFTSVAVWVSSVMYGWDIRGLFTSFIPISVLGLASWAGFFYGVCGYSLLRRIRSRGAPPSN